MVPMPGRNTFNTRTIMCHGYLRACISLPAQKVQSSRISSSPDIGMMKSPSLESLSALHTLKQIKLTFEFEYSLLKKREIEREV